MSTMVPQHYANISPPRESISLSKYLVKHLKAKFNSKGTLNNKVLTKFTDTDQIENEPKVETKELTQPGLREIEII